MKLLIMLACLFGLCSAAYGDCTVSHTIENNTTAPTTVGQSWTALCSGNMTSITVKADLPNPGAVTVSIYQGQSHAAPDLLHMQTGSPDLVHGENVITLTVPVIVTEGQQYTFLLTNESANGTKIRYDVANGYAGGQATAGAGFVAGSDLWFRISILSSHLSVPAFSEWGGIFLSLLILAAALLMMKKKALQPRR